MPGLRNKQRLEILSANLSNDPDTEPRKEIRKTQMNNSSLAKIVPWQLARLCRP